MSHNRHSARNDDNQRTIVDYMRKRGAMVKITKRPFDLSVIWGGIPHWVEVKSAKGKLNANQRRDIEECSAHGVTVHVIRSVADADTLLTHLLGKPSRGDDIGDWSKGCGAPCPTCGGGG